MKDPFKYLDDEEKELIESVERGEWKRTNNFDEEKKKAELAANSTFTETESMNISISKRDVNRLKIRALEEGIPYPALVSGVIHKYLDGKLSESLRTDHI
ncbi:MAG: antitoxin [Desulfobacterales bacterium]|nr:antitoxin [Desulfobacterales bacterium]